jgi:hypothetical protein
MVLIVRQRDHLHRALRLVPFMKKINTMGLVGSPNYHEILPVVCAMIQINAPLKLVVHGVAWVMMPQSSYSHSAGRCAPRGGNRHISDWSKRDNSYEWVQMPAYAPLKRICLFLLHAKKPMLQAIYAQFIEHDRKTEL